MLINQESAKRTYQVKKNVFFSLFLRGASILLSLLLVPLTLEYLGKEEYGIWLTITSIVAWLAYFDIGLGNGLRNNLTECLTHKDYALAKEYISTTYALLGIVIVIFYSVFVISNFWLSWDIILNTTRTQSVQLSTVCFIVFTGFCIKLLLDVINIVVISNQNIYITNALNLLISIFTYAAVYIITKRKLGNNALVIFSFWYSFIPVIIGILASLFLFYKKYPSISPSIHAINFNHSKKLLSLGFQFFFIQIIVLIIFSTDNLIITQLFGPTDVPAFNIAFKYFSIITIGFNIIIAPFWSAFTEAYAKEDFNWIKRAIHKLVLLWILLLFSSIIMLLLSPIVYKLWIGEKIQISFITSLSISAFVLISCWNNIFTYFLNGVSKVRLQLYVSIVIGILNIPLAIILSKIDALGISAVAIANCLCLMIGSVMAPLQYYKIINKKAKGIWNK